MPDDDAKKVGIDSFPRKRNVGSLTSCAVSQDTASSSSASAEPPKVGKRGYSLDIGLAKTNSFLTKSKFFKKSCKDAFKDVDLDGSNSLDFAEVYCAILLLYTKLL